MLFFASSDFSCRHQLLFLLLSSHAIHHQPYLQSRGLLACKSAATAPLLEQCLALKKVMLRLSMRVLLLASAVLTVAVDASAVSVCLELQYLLTSFTILVGYTHLFKVSPNDAASINLHASGIIPYFHTYKVNFVAKQYVSLLFCGALPQVLLQGSEGEGEEDKGGEEEEEKAETTPFKIATTLFCIMTFLALVTVAFETGKDYLMEEVATRETKPVIAGLFSELTVLGFLSLVTFVVSQTPLLKDVSGHVFGEGEEREGYLMELLEQVRKHFATPPTCKGDIDVWRKTSKNNKNYDVQ